MIESKASSLLFLTEDAEVSKLKLDLVDTGAVVTTSSPSSSGDNHFSNATFISSNVNLLNSFVGSGCSFDQVSTCLASSLNGVDFNLTLTDDLL